MSSRPLLLAILIASAVSCDRSGADPGPLLDEVAITTAADLPDGQVGEAYEQRLQASGGSGQFDWRVVEGSLPQGLVLASATGVIRGAPSTATVATFTVRASSGAQADSRAFTLRVSEAPEPPAITTPETLPDGEVGRPYRVELAASGGSGPYSWTQVEGGLPPGVALEGTTGILAGIPDAAGSSSFMVRLTSGGQIAEKRFRLEVADSLPDVQITTPAALPEGMTAAPYEVSLAAAGGTGTYVWEHGTGNLPPGIALDGVRGVLAGTPNAVGIWSFSLRARSAAKSAEKAFTLSVRPGAPSISIVAPLNGAVYGVRSPVDFQAVVTPATATVRWELAVYGEPQGQFGLGMSTRAAFEAGQFTATAIVEDPAGRTAQASVDFIVRDPGGDAGQAWVAEPSGRTTEEFYVEYGYQEPTNGWARVWLEWGTTPALGNKTYLLPVTFPGSGGLPCSTACNAHLTGLDTGTIYYLQAVGENAYGLARSNVQITATLVPYTITTPPTLPSGSVGQAYSVTLMATGGDPLPGGTTLLWLESGGQLPPGVTLSLGGELSGTPTVQGTYSFEVRVQDPKLQLLAVVRTFTLEVGP